MKLPEFFSKNLFIGLGILFFLIVLIYPRFQTKENFETCRSCQSCQSCNGLGISESPCFNGSRSDAFFFNNITPTEDIDPEYLNPNEERLNYFNWMRVGDIQGVDLNCNNVTRCDLVKWMAAEDPDVIYEYVYRYDPSVDINNPIDAPRILKMLLRNLPQKHRFISILRKCLPMPVRVA